MRPCLFFQGKFHHGFCGKTFFLNPENSNFPCTLYNPASFFPSTFSEKRIFKNGAFCYNTFVQFWYLLFISRTLQNKYQWGDKERRWSDSFMMSIQLKQLVSDWGSGPWNHRSALQGCCQGPGHEQQTRGRQPLKKRKIRECSSMTVQRKVIQITIKIQYSTVPTVLRGEVW
jgi:hypothetical protein